MPRRTANDGTVYQKDGGWVAMLELPRLANGKRRRGFRRARTKSEAQQLLRQMRDELNRTGTLASARRRVTDSITTYRMDRSGSDHDDWSLGLLDEGLGHVRLTDLTVTMADDFLRLCATGLNDHRPIGQEQMRKVRQSFVAVLRNEMRVGNLTRNVADLSNLPVNEVEERERRALTSNELQALLEVAEASRLIIIDFCGRNGLRPAEARSIRWSDVDLDQAELTVSGQMNRGNEFTGPKTPKAVRTIQLDRTTINRLKIWREDQLELRHTAGGAWQDLDLIASTGQGTPVDRHSLARSLRTLCAEANVMPPVTPYELRHTAISMQADAGRSSWEIADWAGTSEAMINRVYRHRLRRVAALTPASGEQDNLRANEHRG